LVDDIQFREANEEVAFPLCSPHVHTLCTIEPFVSPNRVLVTPVIAFLDDISVLEELRAAPREVAYIFDHPLEALLDPELLRSSEEKLVPFGSEDWPYETELHSFSDVPWLGTMYRMHRFRSTASPVKGLTADILVSARCAPTLNTFTLTWVSSVNELALYICIACDGGNCLWTRASVSEVGTWAVENLCGGSARCGSCYHPGAITASRTT